MNPTPSRARLALPRLRRWYWKFLYVIVGIAVYYLVGALAPTDDSRGILRSVLVFLLVILAARVFRDETEPDDGPRAWWRMTGRPLAGFVLGGLLALTVIALVAYAYGLETEAVVREARSQEPVVIASAILFAALAVLYLTSSVRLRSLQRDAQRAEERAHPTSGSASSNPGN